MNERYKISQADVSWLEQIVKLNRVIFDKMYEDEPYSLEHYQKKLCDKKPLIFIAQAEGQLVADSIAFEKENRLYIWVLGVAKEHRNQGIASKFLDRNEQFARDRAYGSVVAKVFNVSLEMQKLLIERGYREVGVDLSETGSKYNAVHFELKI